MAHPLDDIAEWLRSAPLGFDGFSAERIDRTLEAIDDAKRATAFIEGVRAARAVPSPDAWLKEWASKS